MTTNFIAILRKKQDVECRRVRVSKAIQDELAAEFDRQTQEFLVHTERVLKENGPSEKVSTESERIPFFPIYQLNDHRQIFEVENFDLEPCILSAAKSPDSNDDLRLDDTTMPRLRALCAVTAKGKSVTVQFQAFEQRRLLSKDRFHFLQGASVFSRLQEPGFTVGDSIHALYQDGTLLFRSFPMASRFLSLVDLFNEASNDKIERVLKHKVLHVGNMAEVVKNADTVMRKQFAAVADLGVLDAVEPKSAKKVAAEFDIDLTIHKQDGKVQIEFPPTKKEQKEMLTFLTEGLYKGPITGKPYESNSHHPRKSKKAK